MEEEEYYDDSLETTPEEVDDDLNPEEEGFLKGYDEAYDHNSDEDDIDKEFE